eukprot:TRINITY_DN6735_c0_g3_i1.p1 TRINITY_DN6735_c0_g3~~TRINITY_DN6735_c0_g3_i1.p1  ORF type:complete len:620 (+),score=127.05 TRINITY_DN6735_c0_g3_i1:90-1862(+)
MYVSALSFAEDTAVQLIHQSAAYLESGWNWWNFMIYPSFLVMFVCRSIGVRYGGEYVLQHVYLISTTIASVTLGFRCLRIFISFKSLGPLVFVLNRVMFDLFKFLVIAMSLHVGFSISMDLLLSNESIPRYDTFLDIFYNLATTFLTNVDDSPFNSIESVGTFFVVRFLYSVYVILFVIVLINLLIVMMNTTFSSVSERAVKHFHVQKALMTFTFDRDTDLIPPPFTLFVFVAWIPYVLFYVLPNDLLNKEDKRCRQCWRKFSGTKEFIADSKIIGRFQLTSCCNEVIKHRRPTSSHFGVSRALVSGFLLYTMFVVPGIIFAGFVVILWILGAGIPMIFGVLVNLALQVCFPVPENLKFSFKKLNFISPPGTVRLYFSNAAIILKLTAYGTLLLLASIIFVISKLFGWPIFKLVMYLSAKFCHVSPAPSEPATSQTTIQNVAGHGEDIQEGIPKPSNASADIFEMSDTSQAMELHSESKRPLVSQEEDKRQEQVAPSSTFADQLHARMKSAFSTTAVQSWVESCRPEEKYSNSDILNELLSLEAALDALKLKQTENGSSIRRRKSSTSTKRPGSPSEEERKQAATEVSRQ